MLRRSSRCQGQCSKSWIGGPPRMSYTRLTHGLFGDGVGTHESGDGTHE